MIQPMFDIAAVTARMVAQTEKIERYILNFLHKRGEEFVNECKDEDTYEDDTSNLRSSIGFFIYKGTQLIEKQFAEAEVEGQDAAEGIVSMFQFQSGYYYLVGVAGMEYAADVEAKGYNVISNQALKYMKLIEGDFEKLKNRL